MSKTSDMKPTVSLTSVNAENLSRHQMIKWVNDMVNGNFKKIEEMSSGVAYCQMMEMISPSCINMKRVKMSAKLEHECFHNMKILQGAFQRLKMDKTLPLDRMIKGRFQDNFEFLQWFKKFFDSQLPGLENIRSAANEVQPKPIVRPRAAMTKEDPTHELQATIDELNTKTFDTIEKRDLSYSKLRKIEILLRDTLNKNEDVDFCNRVLEVLYKTDQNENVDGKEGLEDNSTDSAIDDVNEGMY